MFSNVFKAALEISDFEYTVLRTRLEKRNTLSDPQYQCLYYDTIDGPIGILENDDLQNAVRYVRDRGQNSLVGSTSGDRMTLVYHLLFFHVAI